MSTNAIKIGEAAPDFSLRTASGDEWRLADHRGSVIAMLFYPKDETLVCTKQLCSVRDHWQEYVDSKAVVVGISAGSVQDHKEFARRNQLPLQLLADTDGSVTEQYCRHWLIPANLTRSIIIVDGRGVIRSKRQMFRGFRPSDRSVMASIYAARADVLNAEFKKVADQGKGE